ncbi:MAG: hypothetical protein JXA22_04325 [Candidatus Thermoplasmatota archaeon]|nr:hypothetical protein [Candidatus Thermoplasmatota archaeon]
MENYYIIGITGDNTVFDAENDITVIERVLSAWERGEAGLQQCILLFGGRPAGNDKCHYATLQ